MGLCIYTLYICLLLSITGPGLALRGPEGSVDKAVILLARGCRKVIQAFALALNLFITSVILQVRAAPAARTSPRRRCTQLDARSAAHPASALRSPF